ncbi:MAG: DUF1156 domain-containing protein [Firmicutes bacterium]|nr:DUF1156 domain-containing protein [Bacillota bacterium]
MKARGGRTAEQLDGFLSSPKQLIEVALPLKAINAAAAREKSLRVGHPSTLQLWWSRKPMAVVRALLVAALVDDPSVHPQRFPTAAAQQAERLRLFRLIGKLARWESTADKALLKKVRYELQSSLGAELPTLYDPFCGGGMIPLEAQRLGLPVEAGDLNPVAVLTTKAMVEIPPLVEGALKAEAGLVGLAEDIRRYGAWLGQWVYDRIGRYYPPIRVKGGQSPEVIAYLWARTVRCPNPACGVQIPLVTTFRLSRRPHHFAGLVAVVDRQETSPVLQLQISHDPKRVPAGTLERGGGHCLVCGNAFSREWLHVQGRAGQLGLRMLAMVAAGPQGRIYFEPTKEQQEVLEGLCPSWTPEEPLVGKAAKDLASFGITRYADLFTSRQLLALTTFCDGVAAVRERIYQDALVRPLPKDGRSLQEGGQGARAYAEAVSVYLALAVNRLVNRNSMGCVWNIAGEKIEQTLARQALPMIWNFAEVQPFSHATGGWQGAVEWIADAVALLPAQGTADVHLADAAKASAKAPSLVICTDPPYYDTIHYADLSDFFYIWLRRMLRPVYPELFATVLTPKTDELVASTYHAGRSPQAAQAHFQRGIQQTLEHLRRQADPRYPVLWFYAFKQAHRTKTVDGGKVRTWIGWEAMLSAILASGFQLTAAYPLRTERPQGLKSGNDTLATSVLLVLRPKPADAPTGTRQEFLARLRETLPVQLAALQQTGIAASDLLQAAIGWGMVCFSAYQTVLDADGMPLSVAAALGWIDTVYAECCDFPQEAE